MKKILILALSIFVYSFACGQTTNGSRNTIRTSANFAFFGWGDTMGHTLSVDYAYSKTILDNAFYNSKGE